MATVAPSGKGLMRTLVTLYTLMAVAVESTSSCTTYAEYYYSGGITINTVSDSTPDECCDLCSNTPTCAHWSVWGSNDKCYLKSADAALVAYSNDIAGDSTNTPTITATLPTTTATSSCTTYDNYYYSGGTTINTASSSTPGECCDLCSNTPTCAHWSVWESDSMCYLKSADATLSPWNGDISGDRDPSAPTPTPTTTTTAPTTSSCTTYADYYYSGGTTINTVSDSTLEECCDLCSSTPTCAHWSLWESNDCYLKSADATLSSYMGDTSGDRDPTTTTTTGTNGLNDNSVNTHASSANTNSGDDDGNSSSSGIVVTIIIILLICCCIIACCKLSGEKDEARQSDNLDAPTEIRIEPSNDGNRMTPNATPASAPAPDVFNFEEAPPAYVQAGAETEKVHVVYERQQGLAGERLELTEAREAMEKERLAMAEERQAMQEERADMREEMDNHHRETKKASKKKTAAKIGFKVFKVGYKLATL